MLNNDNERDGMMSDNGGTKDQNSEYSYSGEGIPHRSYMDASYKASQEVPSSQRSYYTPPVEPEKLEGKKEKKKGGFVKVASLCLVCALLGGAAGGALVFTQLPNYAEEHASEDSSLRISSASSEPVTAKPVVSGEELTGSQIYDLGCTQAVAIKTEITYTNFMGVKTSAAVSGSGFIVTDDGYIVTNYHVIEKAYQGGYDVSVILYNGDTYKAEIIGFEEENDLAVLKINAGNLSAATLGKSSDLKVGETIYCIGNPLGELNFSLTSGRVSALDRDISTTDPDTRLTTTNNMFQMDAAVNEGNSGGPVYNNKGEVIGIVTAKYSETGVEGLGFAIPIDDVVTMVDDIIKNGYVTGKAYFGIKVTTVGSSAAQYFNMVEGAYVSSVDAGSCSEKAGMQKGDIITGIDGNSVSGSSDLTNAKRDYKAGDTVTLTVNRDGEDLDIKIVLDEEPPTSIDPSGSQAMEPDSGDSYVVPSIPKG